MRIAAAIAWFTMALVASFMGILLLVSDEPGATAGRWYVAFAALGVGLGLGAWRSARIAGALVLVSLVATALIAVQAYWIGEFAYLGLTNILIVIGGLASLLAAIAWFRGR